MLNKPQIKAAFFDRDGTIIKEVNYLREISQVELVVPAIEICLALQKAGYFLFVVTNQSGIARGAFDEAFVQTTNEYICELFAKEGVFFEKFYYCPHHPEFGGDQYKKDCDCRKPGPGMILQAAQEYNIDLQQSLMFGDAQRDVQAGIAAGCKSFYIQDVLAGGLDVVTYIKSKC